MYDVYKIRKHFPMLDGGVTMQNKPLVYLDNCSTTFKPKSVIDAELDYYKHYNSNSHRGDYDLSYQMDVMLEDARKAVAKFVNCEDNEVIFTDGTTASLNLVAYSYGLKNLKKDDEIIISVAEHASNVLPWFRIADLTGAKVIYVPLNEEGRVTPKNLLKVITNKTKIVSIAHISNVLGYEVNVKELGKIAHSVGAIMVVDGAQSVPHIPVDFKDLDVDFLAFSAHKMCGPTGIGALIGKYDLLLAMDPFISGGNMNITFKKECLADYRLPPFKFEAGTLNLAGILGFKAAIDFIQSIGIENIREHGKELFKYALSKLEGHDDIIIYNKTAEGDILTFNKRGVFAQDLATFMNYKGIAIRAGEHCAKLLDNFLETKATCRMSTYLYSTKEDIDIFIDALINGGDILDAYFND
ncbi:MAG: cysteine desulfurase [Erysipelotrichaceae bacterium]|jgi:cysteine desulfurase/selenocysteine lyase|nr:cysteine desulfurase [Erysipelotrichaceae bacterium]